MHRTLTLFIVAGPPGSGKSTLARILVRHFDAAYITTDRIRRLKRFKELARLYRKSAVPPESARRQVYAELFKRGEQILRKGRNLILEATFNRKWSRALAKKLTRESGARFIPILVTLEGLPKSEIELRLKKRHQKNKKAASVTYHRLYQKAFEPMSGKHIVIQNTGSRKLLEQRVLQEVHTFS